jgi:hypothetical protein
MRHLVTSGSVQPSTEIVSLTPMTVERCELAGWCGEEHRSVPGARGPSALTALVTSRVRRKQIHDVRAEPEDTAPVARIRTPLGARGPSKVMSESRLTVTSLDGSPTWQPIEKTDGKGEDSGR